MKLDLNFFKKYNINENLYNTLNIDSKILLDIYNDYMNKLDKLESSLADTAEILRRIATVHSVKYRVKNPEHLIEKIIRKSIEKGLFDYSVKNYMDRISDLIGIRVLHLYKDEWLSIHNYITREWDILEQPIANIRDGDSRDIINLYKTMDCQINEHVNGYRSVHYLIKPNNNLDKLVCEIQVRTIFEEGWSEIDHRIRYPYNASSSILREYLEMFNRLAGSADEMGTFVKKLNDNIKKTESMYKKELQREVRNREKIIKKQIKELDKRDSEIEKLKATIIDLKVSESQKENLLSDLHMIQKRSHLIEDYHSELINENHIQEVTNDNKSPLLLTNQTAEEKLINTISIKNLVQSELKKKIKIKILISYK